MEPVIALLVATLGPKLVEVFGELVKDVATDIAKDTGFKPLKDWAQRGYDERADGEALRQSILAALDELTAAEPDAAARVLAVNKLTGLTEKTRAMLAAAAVEMTRPDPATLPAALTQSLDLDERGRLLLARFLALLRNQLKDKDKYRDGIAYADRLDERGELSGLALRLSKLQERMDQLLTVNEALLKFRGLELKEENAAQSYLAEIRQMLTDLPLPLARKRAEGPVSARLRQVFVPLSLHDRRAEARAHREAEKRARRQEMSPEREPEIRPAGWGEVLARYPAVILIGPPGCGKTTLLRRAALAFADGQAERDLDWPNAPAWLPIYARLRNFAVFLQAKPEFSSPAHGALTAYLDHYFRTERSLDLTADFFENRLREGNCLVLLDGLDEVSEQRENVAQQVEAFVSYYQPKGNHFGLGSRPRGYESVEACLRRADLAECEVNPLSPPGIRALIRNLFEIIESDSHKWEKDTQELAAEILASSDLTSLASTPLFCTALVQVYKYHGAKLPHRRVDVFQEIVDLLLGFWKAQDDVAYAADLAKEDGTGRASRYADVRAAVDIKRARLCMLADHIQRQRQKQGELPRSDAVRILVQHLQTRERVKDTDPVEEWAENFLINAHDHSNLLVELEPGVHAFVHQYFREYLAAVALTNIREREDFIRTVLEHIQDDWWEQVILLAGAHEKLNDSWRSDMVNAILDAGEKSRGKSDRESWLRHMQLAGRAARDMAERLPGCDHERLEETLRAAATNPELPPPSRAVAADALDELGWLPSDLYQLVRVRSDDFSRSEAATTGEEFWIGKYPVTNAQYAHFLEAEDFADPGLWRGFLKFAEPSKDAKGTLHHRKLKDWGDEGLVWLKQARQNKELSPDGRRVEPRYWREPRFGVAHKGIPVVGVTFWEANAFCRWLRRHWDDSECADWKSANPDLRPNAIRLPTEAEWIWAAGGDKPEARFPWDAPGLATQNENDILRRANVAGSNIGRTTPVGMYPLGVCPRYGLWDMAGNVWEWQANYSDKNHDLLALRGGSWYPHRDLARLSGRYDIPPSSAWYDFGFRVVVALPS